MTPLAFACTGSRAPSEAPASGEQGSIVAIAAMSQPRFAHTATTLSDGRVLIVGGLEQATTSAELFDPATRTFSPTGSLRVARISHSATLLSDGRVLIAGGYNGGYVASTELYEPTRGVFVPGPDMTQPRMGHLAITLRDGRTLFVGGQSAGTTFLASAELYDPATNRFVATGSMSVPRESHVGALLPDGSVLVAGGHSGRRPNVQIYASAERYDPTRGVFVPAGSMTRRRHKHSGLALADGRVLVTGGADERDDQGEYRDAERYDPASDRFSTVGQMRRDRYKHQDAMVRLRDGRVLIAGGAGEAEVFDPALSTFSLVRATTSLAGSFSAVAELRDGSVLITGGYGNGTNARASAWLYLPPTSAPK
jgi:phosphatidylserine/phosphatidylglycerophosphate/cardiolipin synthase-like enzyme